MQYTEAWMDQLWKQDLSYHSIKSSGYHSLFLSQLKNTVDLVCILLQLHHLFSKSANCPHVADPLFCQLGDAEQLQSMRTPLPLGLIRTMNTANNCCQLTIFKYANFVKKHLLSTCVAAANASCVRLDMERRNLPKMTARKAMGGTTISTKAARLGDTYNLRKRTFKS